MNESEVRAVALFFFFAFLDEKRAIDSSMQAISICYDKLKKNPELNVRSAIVFATNQVWEKAKVKITRGKTNFTENSGWILQSQTDIGPWREFQKHATYDELPILIWSKILKINDEEISKGLDLSEGTIRYRLGRALRKLGGMT